MTTEPNDHEPRPAESERETGRTPTEAPDRSDTPEAVKDTTTSVRHTAPPREAPVWARGRGVEWVRPTDLIARDTSRLAGRGIDFHAELARRARGPMLTGARHLGDRARRLPPLSAFGRRGAASQGPVRSGVGMP